MVDLPRTYGVYVVPPSGRIRWLKSFLGSFLRRKEFKNNELAKITAEDSVNIVKALDLEIQQFITSLRAPMSRLKEHLSNNEWAFHYLVTVPLGLDVPMTDEAFKQLPMVKNILRPKIKHKLLPAYMAEKGSQQLGVSITPFKGSCYVVQLYGGIGGEVINGGTIDNEVVNDLYKELRNRDFVSPTYYGIPAYGAVIIIRKMSEVLEEMELIAREFIRSKATQLAEISVSISESTGGHPYDIYHFIYHCVIAETIKRLINEGLFPPITIPTGLIEVLPKNIMKALKK